VRAPEFWRRRDLISTLLLPAAALYAAAGAWRQRRTTPWRAPVPVICVGNLVAGGAGKTPVTASLARLLAGRGAVPHILARGYGGTLAGPVRVDPARHRAEEVGDEPLLLAREAPVWIGRDRAEAAREASRAGAGLLILDDGFQNPSLAKDLSFLVVDGAYGFGNGRVIPAGPLREPIARGLGRAHAVVVLGADEGGVARACGALPQLAAMLEPCEPARFAGGVFVAFAGIGRPEKFFATLERSGARLAARRAFPDHHPFAEEELAALAGMARGQGARLVTTEKDAVRLPPPWRERVETLPVAVGWRDEAALLALIDRFVLSAAPR
jgi:tetraacyldisaccharide 4'-kinase